MRRVRVRRAYFVNDVSPQIEDRLRELDGRIVGHGVEAGGTMYSCAHCAEHFGAAAAGPRLITRHG